MKIITRTFLGRTFLGRALLVPSLILALGFSAVAVAQQQSPDVAPAPVSSTPHYDPRGTTQSVCMAPTVGSCGACTASCTTGQFALCSPGVAMNPQAGSACVKASECKCR